MVGAKQRHDEGAASLFTLSLRRSTRSAEEVRHPSSALWKSVLTRPLYDLALSWSAKE
jgi:hypothetical protein